MIFFYRWCNLLYTFGIQNVEQVITSISPIRNVLFGWGFLLSEHPMSQKTKHLSFRSGPFKQKGRYYNFAGETGKGFLLHTLQMYVTSLFKRISQPKPNTNEWITQFDHNALGSEPRITWIGHASFLIQIGNKTIMTDPIFGHASWLFQRIMQPGVALNRLPKIDVVVLSHNHRDHMDKESLYALRQHSNPLFLVPEGVQAWFEQHNFSNVAHYSWWQTDTTISDLQFTFLPAYHWSQRSLFDQNKTLWGSWLIRSKSSSIYFAGDTGYHNHFSEIGNEYHIDFALLPIGPCEPHEWMKHSHLSAAQSGQAFLDLKADHFVPMHWGTFYFGTDMFLDPIHKLRAWWQRNAALLATKQLHEMKIGQSIQIPQRGYQKTTQHKRPIQ